MHSNWLEQIIALNFSSLLYELIKFFFEIVILEGRGALFLAPSSDVFQFMKFDRLKTKQKGYFVSDSSVQLSN